MKQKYLTYAGVGSRETPDHVLEIMSNIAGEMEERGFILRTGGALGADTAFLDGIQDPSKVELFLPWKDYNGYESQWDQVSPDAIRMASQFHPNWAACKQGARKLHGRNVNIMLGHDIYNPQYSEIVICYTKNGMGAGGTGMAISIADSMFIPVFDLGVNLDHTLQSIEQYLDKFI